MFLQNTKTELSKDEFTNYMLKKPPSFTLLFSKIYSIESVGLKYKPFTQNSCLLQINTNVPNS